MNLEFEDGAVVSFAMNAFNDGGRHIRINGTKGELVGDAGTSEIDWFNFADRTHTTIKALENAAEHSRKTGAVVDINEYIKSL